MGTEILRPQDCLIERLRVVGPTTVFPRRRSYTANNSNPKSCRRTAIRPEAPRKRFAEVSILKKSTTTTNVDVSRFTKNDFVIGQVTILKRDESLDMSNKKDEKSMMKRTVSSPGELIVCGSERLGPDPKQIRISTDLKSVVVGSEHVLYAGSAFYLSPSPSSLPLPTFSKKKEELAIIDDSATKDLRRLLRLD